MAQEQLNGTSGTNELGVMPEGVISCPNIVPGWLLLLIVVWLIVLWIFLREMWRLHREAKMADSLVKEVETSSAVEGISFAELRSRFAESPICLLAIAALESAEADAEKLCQVLNDRMRAYRSDVLHRANIMLLLSAAFYLFGSFEFASGAFETFGVLAIQRVANLQCLAGGLYVATTALCLGSISALSCVLAYMIIRYRIGRLIGALCAGVLRRDDQ